MKKLKLNKVKGCNSYDDTPPYNPSWEEWMYSTLTGNFTFLNCVDFGIELVNKDTNACRALWIRKNHQGYQQVMPVAGHYSLSQQTMNLFVEKYNQYIDSLQEDNHE